MLNQAEASEFEKQTTYPDYKISRELKAKIQAVTSQLSQMQAHAIRKNAIANASSLDEAFQMFVSQVEPELEQEAKDAVITERSFKSRKQLNSFLRRNGYRWCKIAPMGEHEESVYGESYRWQLYSADDRQVTVEEALKEVR